MECSLVIMKEGLGKCCLLTQGNGALAALLRRNRGISEAKLEINAPTHT
jgi:hypothetical protein